MRWLMRLVEHWQGEIAYAALKAGDKASVIAMLALEERDLAVRLHREAQEERDAAIRRADRLTHGHDIESDWICSSCVEAERACEERDAALRSRDLWRSVVFEGREALAVEAAQVRMAVGATAGETALQAVQRVVAERDRMRPVVVEDFLPVETGLRCEALEAMKALKRNVEDPHDFGYDESPKVRP